MLRVKGSGANLFLVCSKCKKKFKANFSNPKDLILLFNVGEKIEPITQKLLDLNEDKRRLQSQEINKIHKCEKSKKG